MKCWVNDCECVIYQANEEGDYNNCEDCEEFILNCSRVVWCNDDRCAWWRKIPFDKVIQYHKFYIPLGDDDAYTGICFRNGVGIRSRIIESRLLETKYRLAECKCRSDKIISGHMDFSRFPQGGNIG
ncbi:MAG: hypothetical protein ABIC57_00525 [bacterium]